MVEGNNSDKKVKALVQFAKLNKEELSQKIALLVSNKSRVIFWKSTPFYNEGLAFQYKKDNSIILTLEKTQSLKKFSNEFLKLYCVIEGIDYFFNAKVKEHNDEDKFISLEINEECFRLEKRLRERAILFPKYEAYFYVRYFIDSPKNVVSFNRQEVIKRPSDDLVEMQRIKMAKEIEAQDLKDDEDIVGLRVDDITSSGLSVILSEKEKNKIFSSVDANVEGMISINKASFNVKEASVTYVVEYIHPNFQNLNMYKVGLSFNHSPTLKRAIEENFGVDQSINDYLNSFEEFLKNE